MKNKGKSLCSYLVSISFIILILITSIDIHGFNRSFFESEYAKSDTAVENHMSQADLMKATNTLLDYLQDKRDDIQVVIKERGMDSDAFNEREASHMVDVKNLYQSALDVRLIATLCLVVTLIFFIWKCKKECLESLAKGYIKIAIFFICLLCFLGIWAITDFTSLWESFHRVFFTNDLWLLNPRTDLMINMFPETFFFHMVERIAITFIVCFIVPLLVSIYYLNKKYHFLHRYNKEIKS